MQKTVLILACSSLIAALPAQGQGTQGTQAPDANPYSTMSAGSFRRLTVPGDEVAKNVKRLTTELHGAVSRMMRMRKPTISEGPSRCD